MSVTLGRGLLAMYAAAATLATGRHVYLSTGCLHGDCGYCQSLDGRAGAKQPAQCKTCTARCICRCHRRPAPFRAAST